MNDVELVLTVVVVGLVVFQGFTLRVIKALNDTAILTNTQIAVLMSRVNILEGKGND